MVRGPTTREPLDDRRIRIALYMKGFPTTETGGPVLVAYHVARELLHSGSVNLSLIVQTDSNEEQIRKALGDPRGLTVIRLGYYASFGDLRSVPAVARAFRRSDLIHFNEFPIRELGYVVLARVRGVPTVYSIHGLVSEEANTFLGPSYPLRVLSGPGLAEVRAPRLLVSAVVRTFRWIAPTWTAAVANSKAHAVRAAQVEHFDSSRIRLIPNGVEMWSPPPSPPVAHDGPPRLLFVGKLELVKGPDLLLEALDLLARRGVHLELSLAGGGSLEGDLRSKAERLGGHRVTFLGSVNHEVVNSLYEWADIVVVPSRYEAFGLVILEAMAAGRPIVATAVGGIPEVVSPGRNAILVAPDADSIAEGIRQLIAQPELRTSMAKANLLDAARYSWSEVAPKYLALYRNLVRGQAVG
jgi:glycosyltransferase involved in cell wall biosynthesis